MGEEVGDTLHLRDVLHVCKPMGAARPELAADCSWIHTSLGHVSPCWRVHHCHGAMDTGISIFSPLCPFFSSCWFAVFAPCQNHWYKRLLAGSEVFLSAFCEFFCSLLCILEDHCNPCICSGSWANLNSPSVSLHCYLLSLGLQG